jgi:hypothetical protein
MLQTALRSWRKLILRSALVLIGLAFILVLLMCLPIRGSRLVPQDCLDLIQHNMVEADLERVIGFPPGDYRSYPTEEILGESCGVSWEDDEDWFGKGLPAHVWNTDTSRFEAVFLESGQVAYATYQKRRRKESSAMDVFLWRIKTISTKQDPSDP